VKDFFIYLKPDSNFRTVVAEVEVEGEADCATLDIPALDVHTAIDLSGGKGRIELDLCPALWSPDKPKLYDVSIGVGADRVNDRVGFREIRVRGTEIFLNGKFIYLLGSNAHEDDEKTGKVTSEADIRRRFAHAKEMNCNYMRLAHYPHHEMASKIADEMGILLWEEIPVYWAIAFDNPDTIRDGRNQMTELVKRDRNRASVIIWSVGNENADTDARLRFMTGLVDICRTLDPTRLVTAACLVNHAELRIVDRLADHLDIIGLNEYYGWYEEDFDELITLGRNSNPDKPVVISETGADGVLLEHAPRHGPFSLEWMARVYRQQTEFLEKLDYVKGFTPWIMYDFRAERRQNDFQRGWNCKGALGRDKKTRKEAFYILQAFYGRMKEKMNGKA
jgi:beta-glucuronidase